MDLDKLNIKPQEIDKNTNRIILPSASELGRIMEGSPKPEIIAQAAAATGITGYGESSSAINKEAQDQVISEKIYKNPGTSKTEPASLAAAPEVKATPVEFMITPMKLVALCLLFLTLPLGFTCFFLMKENVQIRGKFDTISRQLRITEDQFIVAEKKMEQSNLTLINAFNHEKEILNDGVAKLRGEVDKINVVATAAEEAAPLERDNADAEPLEFVYKDENGNILSEEEVVSGDYLIAE